MVGPRGGAAGSDRGSRVDSSPLERQSVGVACPPRFIGIACPLQFHRSDLPITVHAGVVQAHVLALLFPLPPRKFEVMSQREPTAAELLASEEADRLPTGLDLSEVRDALLSELGGRGHEMLRGYVSGKTAMRDALTGSLRCSLAQGELLVDTLEARGLIRFDRDNMPSGLWQVSR